MTRSSRGPDELLTEAVHGLRERRTTKGVAATTTGPATRPLADRVRALWPVLIGDEGAVLDQAIGLAMYDPDRYSA